MKPQVKFLKFIILAAAAALSAHSCIPSPIPPIHADRMYITYRDSNGNLLIDTAGNSSVINYKDIVVSRVLPDGTIREFRGDSLPLIFMINREKNVYEHSMVLITNGWLPEPEDDFYQGKKNNGDYSGNTSEVTTYIKLSDSLPVDTIKVEVINRDQRYKAFAGIHGYAKVYLNGELVNERTIDDMVDGKNVCHLTITK